MGVGAGGAMMGLAAAKSAYQGFRGAQQSGLLRENASIMEANAPYARAAGQEKARQLQTSSYLLQGRQKAGYAGAGMGIGGSVWDVMNDTATNYTRDAALAILEGELQARGMKRQADLYRTQASSTMRDAIIGGIFNLGAAGVNYSTVPKYTSVIGGGGGYASMQAQRMNLGVEPFGNPYWMNR